MKALRRKRENSSSPYAVRPLRMPFLGFIFGIGIFHLGASDCVGCGLWVDFKSSELPGSNHDPRSTIHQPPATIHESQAGTISEAHCNTQAFPYAYMGL